MGGKSGGEKVISPEMLRCLLDYDPETGSLSWRDRARGWNIAFGINPDKPVKRIKPHLVGKPAGYANQHRHLTITIAGYAFRAHRIAWAIHHDKWPENEIDHINGDGGDNRIANLRDVPHAMNMRNLKRAKNNKSGINGVHWSPTAQKWRVQIRVSGKTTHIGVFDDLNEARAARKRVEASLGFHANHGRVSIGGCHR